MQVDAKKKKQVGLSFSMVAGGGEMRSLFIVCALFASRIGVRVFVAADGDVAFLGYERSFDGSGNNVGNKEWGSVGTPYARRRVAVSYADGTGKTLSDWVPSPRNISNLLLRSSLDSPKTSDFSVLHAYFGQWLTFDLTHAQTNKSEPHDMILETTDWAFSFKEKIPFQRTKHVVDETTGVRDQLNFNTPFIDGEQVYSNSIERSNALRSFKLGKLKEGPNRTLPLSSIANTCGCSIANPRKLESSKLYFTGNVRCNAVAPILALHTIFLREHNRICDEYALRFPSWSDQKLFEKARAMVVAHLQKIAFYEYLPLLTGPILPYDGYVPDDNPALENFFAAASFRFGHSVVPANIPRFPESSKQLRTALFDTDVIDMSSPLQIEMLLKGLSSEMADPVDTTIVPDLAGFLVSSGGLPNSDLAARNVLRGRDHGLPDYNSARIAFGLDPVHSFDEFDEASSSVLKTLYDDDVGRIDSWVGGLAERHVDGLPLGPLFLVSIRETFLRVRSADRFWFENDEFNGLSSDELESIFATNLRDIIVRNTEISPVEMEPFKVREKTCSGYESEFAVPEINIVGARKIAWTVDDEETIYFTFTMPRTDNIWQAIAFGAADGAMFEADIIIVHHTDANTTVTDRSGVDWLYPDGNLIPQLDVESGGTSDVEIMEIELDAEVAKVTFKRLLCTPDTIYDKNLGSGKPILTAVAWGEGDPRYHKANTLIVNVDFTNGRVLDKPLSWRAQLRLLHGSLLGSVWGINAFVGVIVARYYRKHPWWFGELYIFFLIKNRGKANKRFRCSPFTPNSGYNSYNSNVFCRQKNDA